MIALWGRGVSSSSLLLGKVGIANAVAVAWWGWIDGRR